MSNEIIELKKKCEEQGHVIMQLQSIVIDLQRQYNAMSQAIGKQGAYAQQIQYGCGKILGDFENRLGEVEKRQGKEVANRPTLAEVVTLKVASQNPTETKTPENISA